MDRRRLWLRLVVLDVLLLATLTIFVWFEAWLVRVNLQVEGGLTRTLEMVMAGERAVLISVLVSTAAAGVAGVVYAWSVERQVWPFVALGVVLLVYAFIVLGARPSSDVRERALSMPEPDLEKLLR